ncbi:GntR family transcriptional regulator [Xanthomonas campestris pv. campestris]|nr:GntR family transcriptional regulator [Xanthomonas campestris]MDO0789606.1 GntR family transcriptional regulator [Xanthomonas campestris pv. campestris]MDO0837240.1 GntR family transcriptional regulator [Xanthomonas campestris pv. campestris]
MLLYESLATQLRQQIERGTLRAGERLPSIRQLAASWPPATASAPPPPCRPACNWNARAASRRGHVPAISCAPLPRHCRPPRPRHAGVRRASSPTPHCRACSTCSHVPTWCRCTWRRLRPRYYPAHT